jgi:hypothetical protein
MSVPSQAAKSRVPTNLAFIVRRTLSRAAPCTSTCLTVPRIAARPLAPLGRSRSVHAYRLRSGDERPLNYGISAV